MSDSTPPVCHQWLNNTCMSSVTQPHLYVLTQHYLYVMSDSTLHVYHDSTLPVYDWTLPVHHDSTLPVCHEWLNTTCTSWLNPTCMSWVTQQYPHTIHSLTEPQPVYRLLTQPDWLNPICMSWVTQPYLYADVCGQPGGWQWWSTGRRSHRCVAGYLCVCDGGCPILACCGRHLYTRCSGTASRQSDRDDGGSTCPPAWRQLRRRHRDMAFHLLNDYNCHHYHQHHHCHHYALLLFPFFIFFSSYIPSVCFVFFSFSSDISSVCFCFYFISNTFLLSCWDLSPVK